MKIDLLITELFTGGAERCCAELARYLQEQGHSVRVISIAPAPVSNVDSLLYEQLNDHKIPTVFLNASKSYQLPLARSKLVQQIRNDPPDLAQSFLWHANLRRLDFESIRDSMLLLSGKIDRAMGGRAVNITDEPYSYRRTIYGFIDRDKLSELQSQFDFADPNMANSMRSSTIVPQQALFFMNNPLAIEVARNVNARPEMAKATSDDERITQLYRIMYQRSPTVQERQIAREFVTRIAGYIDEPVVQAPSKGDKAARAKAERVAKAKADKAALTKGPSTPEVKIETSVKGGKIVNNTEMVSRKEPSNPWVMLAQSMICSNEFVYLN